MLFHPNLPEPFSKEDPLRKKRRKDASVPLDPGMIKDLEDKKPSPFEPLSAPDLKYRFTGNLLDEAKKEKRSAAGEGFKKRMERDGFTLGKEGVTHDPAKVEDDPEGPRPSEPKLLTARAKPVLPKPKPDAGGQAGGQAMNPASNLADRKTGEAGKTGAPAVGAVHKTATATAPGADNSGVSKKAGTPSAEGSSKKSASPSTANVSLSSPAGPAPERTGNRQSPDSDRPRTGLLQLASMQPEAPYGAPDTDARPEQGGGSGAVSATDNDDNAAPLQTPSASPPAAPPLNERQQTSDASDPLPSTDLRRDNQRKTGSALDLVKDEILKLNDSFESGDDLPPLSPEAARLRDQARERAQALIGEVPESNRHALDVQLERAARAVAEGRGVTDLIRINGALETTLLDFLGKEQAAEVLRAIYDPNGDDKVELDYAAMMRDFPAIGEAHERVQRDFVASLGFDFDSEEGMTLQNPAIEQKLRGLKDGEKVAIDEDDEPVLLGFSPESDAPADQKRGVTLLGELSFKREGDIYTVSGTLTYEHLFLRSSNTGSLSTDLLMLLGHAFGGMQKVSVQSGATQDFEMAYRRVDGRFVPVRNYRVSTLRDLHSQRDLERP